MPIRYWYVLVWITYVRSLHSNKSKESAQWTTPELQYLLINYLPVFRVQKKTKKPWPRTREKNISNHGPGGKEKSFLGKKERKDQPRPTPWKKIKGYLVSGQKKTKKPSANTAML